MSAGRDPHLRIFRSDLFAGRTALVIGGTSGINLAIAQALAALGARVAILGRNPEKAATAAASFVRFGQTAFVLTADVRDLSALDAEVARMVAALGAIDFVVAGAAGNFIAPVDTLSANGFKAVVDIDLIGTFHSFKAVRRHLRTPNASLIAISAGQATRPGWGQAHAASAKAGVEALVKALALEWGGDGIRVNTLTPGAIAGTEGVARLISPEAQAQMAAALPARRLGRTDEIAAAAVFLLSDAASYMTGATLVVDGGLAMLGHSFGATG